MRLMVTATFGTFAPLWRGTEGLSKTVKTLSQLIKRGWPAMVA